MGKSSDKISVFCRLPKNISEVISFLAEREELTMVVFVRRAIRTFLAGEHIISDSVRITERNHPDYIKKDGNIATYIDVDYHEKLLKVAEEQECTFSQVMYQALIDYCAFLISQDDTGIVFHE